MYDTTNPGGMYETQNPGGSNTPNTPGDLTYYTGTFYSMGTVITLGVFSKTQNEANDIYNDIKEIYDTYDNISDDGYDIYSPQSYDSELAKLNKDRSMVVSDELYELLEFAVYMKEETKGYFNPFLGELNHLWKRYIGYVDKIPPNAGDKACFTRIAQDTYLEFGENNLVTIKNDNTPNEALIDLGGIAKGFATNKAYLYFKSHDIKYYLLNAGSSNLLMGENYNSPGFNIILSYVFNYPNEDPIISKADGFWYLDGVSLGLEAGKEASSSYGNTLPKSNEGNNGDLFFYMNGNQNTIYIKEGGQWKNKKTIGITSFLSSNEAVVTSSPSEQNRFENNTCYHHLISPFTGEPVNFVSSVTVLGEDSGRLDALSTALFVMPDDVRNKYIEENNLRVIITKDEKIIKDTRTKA